MKNELAFETAEAAFETARQMLTDGHYVVMLSKEEQLWIVNYEYSDLNDRNDMVFMPREAATFRTLLSALVACMV